jgi:4-hydroxybenzoate polyprenyltransferase
VTGAEAGAAGGAGGARRLTPWRRWGYRLLPGDLFSYVLHLRPAEWPIMAAHTALGWVLAVGISGVRSGAHVGAAAAALVIWVVLLNGGTLALNTAFDRDEGDIGYLRVPPPVPRYLLPFSVALLVGGQVAALALPAAFQVDYGICFAMSVLYSVPPFRFKAVAGVDWVINMWGFGTLTPFATWAATGRSLDLGHGLVLGAFCPLFAALYPLTQLYQFDEDRRRGDRTLALILGMRVSLAVAFGCALLAFALFAAGAAVLGVGAGWALLLAVPLAAWLAVLLPWYVRHDAWTPAEHQRGMYRALTAWALTDVAVVAVFAR